MYDEKYFAAEVSLLICRNDRILYVGYLLTQNVILLMDKILHYPL